MRAILERLMLHGTGRIGSFLVWRRRSFCKTDTVRLSVGHSESKQLGLQSGGFPATQGNAIDPRLPLPLLILLLLSVFFGSASPPSPRLKFDGAPNKVALREQLLRFTPIGTDASVVATFIKRELERKGNYTTKVLEFDDGVMTRVENGQVVEIGKRSILASFGKYQYWGVFSVYLSAKYAFDNNNKLVDIIAVVDPGAMPR